MKKNLLKTNLTFFGQETSMAKKLNDMKVARGELFAKAEKAIDEGKYDEAGALKGEIEKLNAEMETLSGIISISGQMLNEVTPFDAKQNDEADKRAGEKVLEIRKSSEYTRAFFNALGEGHTLKSAKGKEEYGILYNALTETGGTPVGSEGGFLLPVDFDEKIWMLRKNYIALAEFAFVENVSFKSGWRVREKNINTAKLLQLAEMETIPNAEAPKFIRIDYDCKNWGGIIPVSQDLLDDTPVNIMNYLSGWFARVGVNTENFEIIKLLDKLVAVPFDLTKGVSSLKTVLNKKLNTAISPTARILTNQSGFDALDQLEDKDGRPLLQPDVTNPTQYKVLGRPITHVDDDLLPNTDSKAPLYVGSFQEYFHFFRRQGFEMAATNIGAGAFETNSTRVRGIERFDQQIFDENALVKMEIPLA